MTYEVELKFPLEHPDGILSQLDELNATRGTPIQQHDRYFNHPSRNFAKTDEALRIRSTGGAHRVTYKGPLVDEKSKTRREIEIPFGTQETDAAQFAEMLVILGFQEVGTVSKTRVPYHLHWEEGELELVFDNVDKLGRFLEIEIMADESSRHTARDSILRLAQRLGLENSERRSYLSLLLERDGL
jgi:adenylate cyclase class 2